MRCTHHGLKSNIVANVICVSAIEDGAYAGIDNSLEVWEQRIHQVAGRVELLANVRAGLGPFTLGANFRRHGCAVQVCCNIGRVRIRVLRGHVMYIPISYRRGEDVLVAV